MEIKPLVYLSLGAGVQSTALLAMACHGDLDVEVTLAMFADTQDEPAWVYEHLARLIKMSLIPILSVTVGRLSASPIIRVPAYVPSERGVGPLTQNCTRDYKRRPVRANARNIMRHCGIKRAVCLLGISVDEADRQKPSGVRWLEHRYPLIEMGKTRSACVAYLESRGWPVPKKSACIYCPWHSDRAWRELKEHDPAGFMRAAEYDAKVFQLKGGRVHKSMLPLADIDFTDNQIDLFSNDCEGQCGV